MTINRDNNKIKGSEMNGLLRLDVGMQIEIDLKNSQKPLRLKCQHVIPFENAQNYLSTRYILSDGDETFILDVQKDSMQNISLTCYQLLEEMAFDLNFLSLVGTSPLGYHNPKIPNIDYILYEMPENINIDREVIKFMVAKEDVPEDAEDSGYYQDGNGNWYFMTTRAKGTLLKFEDAYKLAWEYKQERDERLLIELKAFKNMQEYIQQQPSIYIYEGKALHRRDIKIISHERILETA